MQKNDKSREENPGSKEKTENLVENFRNATRGSKRCRRKTKIRGISNHAPTPSLKKTSKEPRKVPHLREPNLYHWSSLLLRVRPGTGKKKTSRGETNLKKKNATPSAAEAKESEQTKVNPLS